MANITHYMHENRERIGVAVRMAWPSVLESFFVALAGLIDSLMVSKMISGGFEKIRAATFCVLAAIGGCRHAITRR